MELSEMTLVDVNERLSALEIEVRSAEQKEVVEAAIEEKKALVERKKELEDAELRSAMAQELNINSNEAVVVEERKENNTMNNIETRNTLEYGKAFVKGLKSGDFTECRSLLSENGSGSVPVPAMVEAEIKNAWEASQIMSLVKRTNYPGNVKVGFEVSATAAATHTEGAAALTEETLVLGTVSLVPATFMKWITVSNEAIEGTTLDTIGYIYKEVAQKIVEAAEASVIAKIIAAPTTSSASNGPAVPVYTDSTLGVDTLIAALGELSGQAKNITVAMNRRTYSALKAAAATANYAVDPFDGCKVVFTDALDAFSAASTDDTYMIAGDFGYGFQANFPSGNDLSLIIDRLSLAEKDLVKIVGRMPVGLGVVAPNAFVKIVK